MKYLTDYIDDKQTALFRELGIFFAFSKQQFKEGYEKANGKDRGKYTNMSMGMFCPSKHVEEFIDQHHEIVMAGIAQDIKENGKKALIRRELFNHEAFYTGDIESTADALEHYPVTEDDIRSVYREVRKEHNTI